MELLVPLFFLWPLWTALGTCRPVTTEKLPFHTCRGEAHPRTVFRSVTLATDALREGFLTMKAGMMGCWNFVLKVCISCLVLAL